MLKEELNSVKHEIVGKRLKPSDITEVIESHIGEKYGLTFSTHEHMFEHKDDANVNAFFDPYEIDNPPNIELVFVHDPRARDGLVFDESGWDFFSFKINQAIKHELRHKYQYSQRKIIEVKNPSTPLEYLSCPDEIDAHAHDIMLELLHYGLDNNSAIAHLKNFSKINPEMSITLFSYLVAFELDFENPVIKRLIKRTVKFLEMKWEE